MRAARLLAQVLERVEDPVLDQAEAPARAVGPAGYQAEDLEHQQTLDLNLTFMSPPLIDMTLRPVPY